MMPPELRGGYAFPSLPDQPSQDRGMELRDYFAAKAMQSLLLATCSSNELAKKVAESSASAFISTDAYRMADAMLKAREK